MNLRDFNKLTLKEQQKVLTKLRLKANRRLENLEKGGYETRAYKSAQNKISLATDLTKLKNERNESYINNTIKTEKVKRFFKISTDNSYNVKQDVKKQFKDINNFLNMKTSLVKNVSKKKQITTDVNKISKKIKNSYAIKDETGKYDTEKNYDVITQLALLKNKKELNFQMARKMTREQKEFLSSELSKVANKRLEKLEQHGITYYAYDKAEYYNLNAGSNENRFKTSNSFNSENDLNIHLENVIHFLNSKSSTKAGLNKIYRERFKAFQEKLKDKGITLKNEHFLLFNEFLETKQLMALGKQAASNQIVEILAESLNKGKLINEINEEFQKFLDGKVELSEVEENLGVAKWLKKGGLE